MLRRVLYIDLGKEESWVEERQELFDQWMGGTGVGIKLLMEECPEGDMRGGVVHQVGVDKPPHPGRKHLNHGARRKYQVQRFLNRVRCTGLEVPDRVLLSGLLKYLPDPVSGSGEFFFAYRLTL